MVELEVPELDTVKLVAPVTTAIEKALAEHAAKTVENKSAFFMLSDKDLGEMFRKLLIEELRKIAVAEAQRFDPKIYLTEITPEKKPTA